MDVKVFRGLLLLTFLTVFLVAVKGTVGFVVSSPVLLIDALHSFTDLFPYLTLLLIVAVLNRKRDETFPYGYYKFESLLLLFLSIFLAYTSFEIFRFGSTPRASSPVAVAVELLSAILSGFMAVYNIELGRKSGLKAIEVVGVEKIADSLISAGGVLVLLLSGFSILQHAFVVLVGTLVILSSLEGFRDSIVSLLDINPSRKLHSEIVGIAGRLGKVSEVRVRKAGPCYFVEIRMVASPGSSMREFELVREKVESEVKSRVENVCEVFVLPEIDTGKLVVAIPRDGGNVSENFSTAEKFLIVDLKTGSRKTVENPFVSKEVRRGAAVARYLTGLGVNAVVADEIGFIAYSALKGSGVVVFRGKGRISQVLKDLRDGKLKEAAEPTRVKL